MITIHCSCGSTIRTDLGPASVGCGCGKVHTLPSIGPAPAAVPAPTVAAAAPAVSEPATPPPSPSRAPGSDPNPFSPRQRLAIHDGPSFPARKPAGPFAALQSPAIAGAVSVGVLLVALLIAIALNIRSKRLREEADAGSVGGECSFVGAGVAFTPPRDWKLTRDKNMVFAFQTPKGDVAVQIVASPDQTHATSARALADAEWKPDLSEIDGAQCLAASWVDKGAAREGTSWWIERGTHRLWISAVGRAGVRMEAKAMFATLKLTTPDAPPKLIPPREGTGEH